MGDVGVWERLGQKVGQLFVIYNTFEWILSKIRNPTMLFGLHLESFEANDKKVHMRGNKNVYLDNDRLTWSKIK